MKYLVEDLILILVVLIHLFLKAQVFTVKVKVHRQTTQSFFEMWLVFKTGSQISYLDGLEFPIINLTLVVGILYTASSHQLIKKPKTHATWYYYVNKEPKTHAIPQLTQ